MATDALVKFVSCDAATFAGLTKDARTLYFVNDERRIYKGDVPMSGGIYRAVVEFPAAGEANVLYVNTNTGEVRFWNGTAYQTVVKPMGSIADGNQGLVTGDQVFDYVAAAVSTINGVNEALAGRVEALEGEQDTQDDAIAAAQAAANQAQNEVDALEGVVATKAAQADLTTLTGRVTTAEGEIDTLQGEMDAVEGAVATKAEQSALTQEVNRAKAAEEANAAAAKAAQDAADAAQADIDAFFAAADQGEAALDTLKELQDYLETEGAAADQMVKDIAANKKAIEDEVARAEGIEADLAEDIEAVAGDVTDLQGQVGTGTVDSRIEAAKTAAATDAKNKADAAQAAAEATAAADATSKADAALAAAKTYADTAEADALAAAKEYADGLAGNYATAAQGAKADTAVQAVTEGTENGTITVNDAGAVSQVKVHGLGSAAYTASSDYATSAQGAKADTALQAANITTGSANGTISVKGTNVAVKGLGSAAYTDADAYATAAQGEKADSAVQSVVTGTANGTIKVDGTAVAVFGLKSAAYTESSAYDAAGTAQTKADAALASAKSYTDTEIGELDTALKAYADQAETDAVNAAKAYAATKAQGQNADDAIFALTWQEL